MLHIGALRSIPPQPKVNAESRADAFAAPIGTTAALNKGYITSDVSMLGRRIEKFGLKRFIAHADTVRTSLTLASVLGALLITFVLRSHAPAFFSRTRHFSHI